MAKWLNHLFSCKQFHNRPNGNPVSDPCFKTSKKTFWRAKQTNANIDDCGWGGKKYQIVSFASELKRFKKSYLKPLVDQNIFFVDGLKCKS
jgi:hypothetical protein